MSFDVDRIRINAFQVIGKGKQASKEKQKLIQDVLKDLTADERSMLTKIIQRDSFRLTDKSIATAKSLDGKLQLMVKPDASMFKYGRKKSLSHKINRIFRNCIGRISSEQMFNKIAKAKNSFQR